MVEGEAARILLHNLRDILADDEDAKADAIEGETNLREAIAAAVQQLQEMEAMAGAIKEREELLYARRQRCLRRADLIRAAVQTAMSEGQMRSLVLPIATLSLKAVPAAVTVIDESMIPSQFFKRADPKLDKRALLAALKDGTKVAGAELSNGGETLSVRP